MRTQQIQIEGGGDAGRVVIGRVQHGFVLHQIDADDQHRAGPEDFAGVADEAARVLGLEIADGGAGEEAGARAGQHVGGQVERLHEIGGDRDHVEGGEIAAEVRRLPP